MCDKAAGYFLKSVAISGKRLEVWQQLATALLKTQQDSAAAEACLKSSNSIINNIKNISSGPPRATRTWQNGKAKELYDKFLDQGFSSAMSVRNYR